MTTHKHAGNAEVGDSTVTKVTALVWLPECLTYMLPWCTQMENIKQHIRSMHSIFMKICEGSQILNLVMTQVIPIVCHLFLLGGKAGL